MCPSMTNLLEGRGDDRAVLAGCGGKPLRWTAVIGPSQQFSDSKSA